MRLIRARARPQRDNVPTNTVLRAAQEVVVALPERGDGAKTRKRGRAASLHAAAPAAVPGFDDDSAAPHSAETPARSRQRAASDASGLTRLCASSRAHGPHGPEAAAVAHDNAPSDVSPPFGGARVTCGSRWAAYLDG